MSDLARRFQVRRLTRSARERMAEDLRRAGLRVSPPVQQAQRTETLRVTLDAPAPSPSGATPAGRRLRRRWIAGAVALVALIVAVALSGGDDHAGTRGQAARSATATPAPTATRDPAQIARRRAKSLARHGRYLAALAALGDEDHALARRLRRRGAHMLLVRARRELARSHEDSARAFAHRAQRLGAAGAAAAVIRTADEHSAAERAAARERRRLAAIARDQRTCSASEKAAVDGGASAPPGCDAYAARVAASRSQESACDPNYAGACLDPNASDYDCAGGSGDGPKYTGTVRVVGDDHFGLDADGDGTGCDT